MLLREEGMPLRGLVVLEGTALLRLLMTGAAPSAAAARMSSALLDVVRFKVRLEPEEGTADMRRLVMLFLFADTCGPVVAAAASMSLVPDTVADDDDGATVAIDCLAAPAAAARARKLLGPTSPLPLLATLLASASLLCRVTFRRKGEGRSSSFDRSYTGGAAESKGASVAIVALATSAGR